MVYEDLHNIPYLFSHYLHILAHAIMALLFLKKPSSKVSIHPTLYYSRFTTRPELWFMSTCQKELHWQSLILPKQIHSSSLFCIICFISTWVHSTQLPICCSAHNRVLVLQNNNFCFTWYFYLQPLKQCLAHSKCLINVDLITIIYSHDFIRLHVLQVSHPCL